MATDPHSAVLQSIQGKIVAKQYDNALIDLEAALESEPTNTDFLYMSAVCRRYKTDFRLALQLLATLKSISPEHGRAHQEEGHTYRDMGLLDDALRSYARASHYNPALEASLQGQLRILSEKGEHARLEIVDAQLQHLRALPRALIAVTDLIAQERILKAEEICRAFLLKAPQHVEGMRLLATIGLKLGVLDDAEFLLESALAFQPHNEAVQRDYISILRKRQKFSAALEQAAQLLATSPLNPQFQSIYAIECMQMGDFDTAIDTFSAVLDNVPGDPVTHTAIGHCHKTCGRYDAAVRSYRAALSTQPQYGEAYYSLANLKVFSFDEKEIAEMHKHEQNTNLPLIDHTYLCFALGKAHEDKKDYGTSHKYYARGNRLKKTQSRYDAEQMTKDMAAMRDVCTAEFFARKSKSGHAAPDPIFIVGLPRAGSTLLEQILSSHSQVDGTLELPNILSLSQRLRRQGRQDEGLQYPELLEEISDYEYEEYGKQYIEETKIHRQGAAFFIDKMPNNFRYVGLIKLMLPNAKIIDARRHPMSCCFSGFKQLFAEGQEFTYDLADVGRYYRDYVELMDHWDKVLPGQVLRVRYEDVVSDVESQVIAILDYCGLPFERACVDFHETERAVRTPSSEQVRRPIFTGGLDQWQNYDQWLAPLRNALGSSLV